MNYGHPELCRIRLMEQLKTDNNINAGRLSTIISLERERVWKCIQPVHFWVIKNIY